MKKRVSIFSGLVSLFVLGAVSCTKINEATELGRDLIPAVDNVNTFETVLDVETFNEVFNDIEDSTRTYRSDQHVLGIISNDPVFGTSNASVYLELKPNLYPNGVPYKRDSLIGNKLDSVVLVLSYTGAWGDTNQLQQVNVHELNQSLRSDTAYFLRKEPVTYNSTVLGTRSFYPRELNDSVKPREGGGINQLRIPLSASFAQRLEGLDSAALKTDSLFENILKGFAIVPQNNGQANALIGLNLGDANTRLSLYYRQKAGANKIDTGVVNWRLTAISGTANYIQRNYSGSQLQSFVGGTSPDNLVFIQNTPGTYARIRVPGLDTLSNRIVHRAELIMEQVTDPLADIFTPPPFLYLDLFDQSINRYKAVPFDAFLNPTSFRFEGLDQYQIANPVEFGMAGKRSGGQYTYRFNISRYIQRVVNNTDSVYSFRLSSPMLYKQLVRTGAGYTPAVVLVNQIYGIGRVRLGGGNHPTNRMRLRIIYSRL